MLGIISSPIQSAYAKALVIQLLYVRQHTRVTLTFPLSYNNNVSIIHDEAKSTIYFFHKQNNEYKRWKKMNNKTSVLQF